MRVAVIGGGVIGVSSAWYLAQAGHEVTLVDRQPNVGLETSYANGGQISVSHADPWATPSNLAKALSWLGREDAPLLFRPRLDIRQWSWALRFLKECLPSRVDRNTRELVGLALYSRSSLGELRSSLNLHYEEKRCGILHIYSQTKAYEHGLRHAERLRRFGCEREPVSREECLRIEPALSMQADRLVGGTFTSGDEIGDAHLFTRDLALHAEQGGVRFLFGHEVQGFERTRAGIKGLRLSGSDTTGILEADAFVLAAGSYSTLLARQLGLRLPVYPAKGYSITLPVAKGARVPVVSLIDDEYKIVVSRLGQRLRVAGTAEFTGFDTELNATRGQMLVDRIQSWFPDLRTVEQIDHWTGLRPATPSNVPLIGRTEIPNLFINTGHGTLGWTMAAGSGRLLADIVSGRLQDWRERIFPA